MSLSPLGKRSLQALFRSNACADVSTGTQVCANRKDLRGSRALAEGMTIMRQSWLYSGLLCVPLLLATGGIAAAQHHAHVDPAADTAVQVRPAALKTVHWSDPAAW